jgi:3-hydroxyacyl-[acyl-carrier-protein] dehydratase
MSKQPLYDTSVILEILPQRTPFLFVDRVMELTVGEKIIAEKDLLPDDTFFAGHFPGRPLMPGVLVSEALAQTSGLLLGLSAMEEGQSANEERPGFFLASVNMKYLIPAKPGDTLRLEAGLVKGFAGLYMFDVAAYVQDTQVAKGKLTLAEERG